MSDGTITEVPAIPTCIDTEQWESIGVMRRRRNFLPKTKLLLMTLLVVIIHESTAAGGGLLCVHPTTTRSQVGLQLLNDNNKSSLSCWSSSSSKNGSFELDSSDSKPSHYSTTLSFVETTLPNIETYDNPATGRLNDFIERLHEWIRSSHLRLTPRVVALVRQQQQQQLLQQQRSSLLYAPNSSTATTTTTTTKTPKGPRWAIATVDLSGSWKPIVTADFKLELNDYLANCSTLNYVMRKIIVNGMSLHKESIRQLQQGRELEIVAANPVGSWNRTLVASGTDDVHSEDYEPLDVRLEDPHNSGGLVHVEAWWEERGTVHKSWLRGSKPQMFGGTFETLRYLESDDGDVLVCESTFHSHTTPAEEVFRNNYRDGHVVWRYQRV
jgi:hypothetical protein